MEVAVGAMLRLYSSPFAVATALLQPPQAQAKAIAERRINLKKNIKTSTMSTTLTHFPENDICGYRFHVQRVNSMPSTIDVRRHNESGLSIPEALDALHSAVQHYCCHAPSLSGIMRFQVPIRGGGEEEQATTSALRWLRSQAKHLPSCYFCCRSHRSSTHPDFPKTFSEEQEKSAFSDESPSAVAGIGSALTFKGSNSFSLNDWNRMRSFLRVESPLIRAYGCLRFNPEEVPSSEWESFGSFYFIIPQVEFDEFESGYSLLAATMAWDDSSSLTFQAALDSLRRTLYQISPRVKQRLQKPSSRIVKKVHIPDKNSWTKVVEKVLQRIQKSTKSHCNSPSLPCEPLSKVVLARSTSLTLDKDICPLELLECLQEKDETAYQFCIRLPDGSAFIGNTPEQLFYRKEHMMSSEAVAGTRHRGCNVQEDSRIALELMSSQKDHNEFDIVRQSMRNYLETMCNGVVMNPEKAIHKQAKVQHLYARIFGELKSEAGEFQLLTSLHPTPAVCGNPQNEARAFISENEMFDRGMYAGPVGWFGGKEAEFAVGIRSSLVKNARDIMVYAGAGIVNGSNPSTEWQELELKCSQFLNLFDSSPSAKNMLLSMAGLAKF